MKKQEECDHKIVTLAQTVHTCQDCAMEFAPVHQFEHQMEVALSAMAVVIHKIAHMNGVPDEAVDGAIAAATAPAPGTGPRTYEENDGHTHQYTSDMSRCILCHRSPYLGG